MEIKRYNLWQAGEYDYPLAFGFVPNIRSYLHGDQKIRPCMLICPGGGYRRVSHTEGEIVALEFYNKGYNTFVLTYTTDITQTVPLGRQPIKDVSRAIRFIRKQASSFFVDKNQIVICGFSAGGHLAASICVHSGDVPDENPKYQGISNRPDAAILSYPVITAGEYAHKGSFYTLYGDKSMEAEEIQYMSLEKHVTPETPPCFIWQTRTDKTVPVENSYIFAKSCKEAGVVFSHHVFSKGAHGLSLANEDWAAGRYGGNYTAEQTELILERVADGRLPVSEEKKEQLLGESIKQRGTFNGEVMIWPVLAEQWLKETLHSQD